MSLQLDQYLAARDDGAPVEIAADMAGFSLVEAKLTEKAIESGEVEFPHARARAREDQSKTESKMARDDVKTSIQVGNGPQIPIDLDNIDNPANEKAKAAIADSLGNVRNGDADTAAAKQLRLFIERVERLDEEIKDLNSDKADVFAEMKANGYDTKTVKTIIKLRKMDSHARQEAAALLETYARAVGLQCALPL